MKKHSTQENQGKENHPKENVEVATEGSTLKTRQDR